jgi:CheY-like chemotaxis protein
LFEMFFQVDDALDRAQGGLGIGLSLVRGLVELHGGSVDAFSDGVGRGSEFVVRLPVSAEHAIAPPIAVASKAEEMPGTARRILVVDDNEDSADTLALLLRLKGHEVETAYDGRAGVAAAERFRPEVVLLDIGMPNLDGREVCRHIRQQSWGSSIVLLAVTGWGQEDDRRRTAEAGFDGHVVKPVDPAALLEVIGSLPATKASQRERGN